MNPTYDLAAVESGNRIDYTYKLQSCFIKSGETFFRII